MTLDPTREELYTENRRLRAIAEMATPSGNANLLYLAGVVALSVCGVAGIVAIMLRSPEKDNTQAVTLVLGFLVPTVLALLGFMQRDTHLAFNSRMTELLQLTAKSSRAEGQLAGLLEPVPGADTTARAEGKAAGVEQERARTEGHGGGV